MKKEEFDEALKLALDGAWRSEKEATLWAIDYLKRGGKENHNVAADAANLMEAERLMAKAQQEIDQQRCVVLRQSLYFDSPQLAEISCKRDPSQLSRLDESETQLNREAAVIEGTRMKDAHGTQYSHEEAEIIARQELGLPKAKRARCCCGCA